MILVTQVKWLRFEIRVTNLIPPPLEKFIMGKVRILVTEN